MSCFCIVARPDLSRFAFLIGMMESATASLVAMQEHKDRLQHLTLNFGMGENQDVIDYSVNLFYQDALETLDVSIAVPNTRPRKPKWHCKRSGRGELSHVARHASSEPQVSIGRTRKTSDA
jgi:hypothetical protein